MDKEKLLLDMAEKLTAVAEDLRLLANSAQTENAACADSLPEKEEETPKAPVKKELEISLEKVRGILADKSRAGHTADVKAIIQKYGADRLSDVNPKDYAAVIKEAEVL